MSDWTKLLLGFAVSLFCVQLVAEDKAGILLEFGYQKDEDDAEDWSFAMTFQADEKSWFDVYFHRTKILSIDISQPNPFANETSEDLLKYGAGYQLELGDWQWGFDVSRWTDDKTIESHDLKISPSWKQDSYELGVNAIYRDLEFKVANFNFSGRTFKEDITGVGYGIFASFFPNERWFINLEANNYDYRGRLIETEAFDFYTRFIFASDDSVLDKSRGVRVGYSFDLGLQSVSLDYQQNQSAFDRINNDQLEFNYQFPLNQYLDLRLLVGHSKAESFDGFYYAGLSFVLFN
ncbi:hypothetical protein [Kangiella sp. TOML190]|uniref:hypothetical protein n=1 Tax=Kangiella sp. TOML190 TaxID=2931351 RepID=UPI00203F952A|nr:hypothetical protein [Kangiella sp. TOML190]